MASRDEDLLKREDGTPAPRKFWTPPKLIRVSHKLAGHSLPTPGHWDGGFAYS